MKRILLATLLSLGVHALLFVTPFGGLKGGQPGPAPSGVVTLELTCRQPPGSGPARGQSSSPAEKATAAKSPEPSPPKKKAVSKPLVQKPKPRPKPVRPTRKTPSPKDRQSLDTVRPAPTPPVSKSTARPDRSVSEDTPAPIEKPLAGGASSAAGQADGGGSGRETTPGGRAGSGGSGGQGFGTGAGGRGSRGIWTARPLYKVNRPPEYPRTAQRRGYQGTVVLAVLVDPHGRVTKLRLHESSGHHMLDKAAMCAVKEWLFEPGKRNDQAVSMWVRIPIKFQLK